MRVEAYNIHYIKQTKVWDITGPDGIGKLMGYNVSKQGSVKNIIIKDNRTGEDIETTKVIMGVPNDGALCVNIYPDPVQVNIPVDNYDDIDAIIEETIAAVEKETLQKVETLSVRF